MTRMLASHDPSTGEKVGEVPVTPSADVPAAVAAARAAQAEWGALPLEQRRETLLRASAIFEARADEIGELMTREMGKPLREAVGEVRAVADMERELAEMVDALSPEVLEEENTRSTVYRDAFGVVAAITPWNFPLMMPHWMVLPALVAGNAVVLKPSEETPLTGQAYADVLNEVLPPGVLSVVHGADDQGAALVQSDVDLIAFTGSRETGKKILTAAAAELKRVVLELGGKDPLIVLDGADLGAAAKFAARNSFRNAGQVCVSTERIYVERAVVEPFLAALVTETEKMVVGDGRLADTRVGPMVSAGQRDHVLGQIDDAVQRGAKVAFGGEGHHGNFVVPTVLTGITEEMAIAREETFGPVACVTPVDDADEAVRRANDTPFGLGAAVFGPDEKAAAVGRKLTAGMIGINRGCGGAFGAPWVGARQSGYGFHSSRDGHRQFAQVRVVTV